jgi:hypothetical protein
LITSTPAGLIASWFADLLNGAGLEGSKSAGLLVKRYGHQSNNAASPDHSLLEKTGIPVDGRRTPDGLRDQDQAMNWLICSAS